MFHHCPPLILEDIPSQTLPSGKRFYTLPDGSRVPSVTTVLGVRKKQGIIDWKKRVGEDEARKIIKTASGRGTGMHALCEDYLNNKPLRTSMPDAKEMFLDIKPHLNRISDIWYEEQAVYSKALQLAGRVDCVAHYDGVLSIIDFKTARKHKKREYVLDYFAQCCAYSYMIEELVGVEVPQIVILMGVTGEKPQVFIEKTEDHVEYLLESIKIYKESLSV